ncbi:hypothetical protein ACE6ED_18050 [Paenibacillus sp. CN-4]|uniref:hypothetical protein n=1 Tax=Paenibacillus nanchangensis TaxID=3348343 RepID=UPI00397C2A01
MIKPVFLRGELIPLFQEHLIHHPYCLVLQEGKPDSGAAERIMTKDEAESALQRFLTADYPLVCLAGSKSSIPFWDYHIALRREADGKTAVAEEMLVREPLERNIRQALYMAETVLTLPQLGIERVITPFDYLLSEES